MKKNAIWSPSDTMIARELRQLGRGIEAYRAAKSAAEATGEPFNMEEPPQLRGVAVDAVGAISVEALRQNDNALYNRGMKLNEAKKLKKENQAKELAKQAAEEAEESARQMAQAAKAMAGIFGLDKAKKSTSKTPSKTPAKKRKRDPSPEADGSAGEPGTSAKPPLKRNKTETPVPAPQPMSGKQISPILPPESAPSVASEAPLLTPTDVPKDALPLSKRTSTPILPPVREPRKSVKKEVKKLEPVPSAATSRPRRTSAAATPAPHTPVIAEPLPAKRPTSSRSKAASVEPHQTTTAAADRNRRTSTARNTPAPEPRQTSKRAKRPAPGTITARSDGATAVSVGKRASATRKKAGAKKEKREGSAVQEVFEEIDDEGNLIDPDEPRYCLCNRVSFGTMISCDRNDVSVFFPMILPWPLQMSGIILRMCADQLKQCEKEWFHIECVGLTEIPARTTKWYCPECRVILGIGEKGEVSARGKKK